MPTCRDVRWHANQEEADACMKHTHNNEFENWSTESRVRKRRRPAATPLQSSGLSDAPPTTLPEPESSTASGHPIIAVTDVDIDPPAQPDIPPAPFVPQSTAQTGMHAVEKWRRCVDPKAPPVPPNVFGEGDIIATPKPNDEGVQPPPAVPSPGPPHTPAAQTGQGGQAGTVPKTDRIIRLIDAGDEDEDESDGDGNGMGTPTPGGKIDEQPVPLVTDDRPWYARENARRTARAAALAVPTGVLLCGLALYRSGRDAERFP